MNELQRLAEKNGTDKGALVGGMNHMYTDIYEPLLHDLRPHSFKMVEIGIGRGASARMWLEYFSGAIIHLIDISLDAIASVRDQRIISHLGDEVDETIWDKIGRELQLVIDDGSHIPDNQIQMFEDNFWRVKPGGFWIIEDLHCNFHPNFNKHKDTLYSEWLQDLIMKQQMIPNGGGSGNFYLERAKSEKIMDTVSRLIYGIRLYKSMIIFERAEN